MKRKDKIVILIFIFSLIFSFVLSLSLYFVYNYLKPKPTQAHYNSTQLYNYFLKKYGWQFTIKSDNISKILNSTKEKIEEDFEFCENLSSKKDKALCKAYLKLQKLNMDQFKNYLPFALAKYHEINISCLIKKGFDKVKLAEFLKNTSICGDNRSCVERVINFINYYQNYKIIAENVNIAYNLYKKGLIKCDKYKECLIKET